MLRTRWNVALIAGFCAFIFHVFANPHYGFFRDELYFIICGRHPQWGYVDQPPIVPLLAAGSQLFGHSLILLRALAAAFGGLSVYVTCLLVAEFGGGTFAMIIAAICATLAPVLAAFAMQVGPDMVGLWLWPLAVLYLVRLSKGGAERQWVSLGAAVGFSIESKYSVIYFVAALLIGLALTQQRRIMRTWWFAAGAAIAIAIALPNFIWQASNGFPMWELLRNGQLGKNVILSPVQFISAQFLFTNPVLALVWVSGCIWLLSQVGTRFLGYAYLILMAIMIASHAKFYYPGDAYPMLFAAGGVAVEYWTQRARSLRPYLVMSTLAAGLALLPYFEPVLPEDSFIRFNQAVGPKLGMSVLVTENNRQTWLTQDWADMHGWPQLAAAVQQVYDALAPSDRVRAVAVTRNFGEASAIAFFSHVPVISGHNQYYLWGTRGYTGDVVIDVGGDCGASARLFRESYRAAVFSAAYIMPYEDDLPIMVCRGITKPIEEIWPSVKMYE